MIPFVWLVVIFIIVIIIIIYLCLFFIIYVNYNHQFVFILYHLFQYMTWKIALYLKLLLSSLYFNYRAMNQ